MTAGFYNIGRTEEYRAASLHRDSTSADWERLFESAGHSELPSRACASLGCPSAGGRVAKE